MTFECKSFAILCDKMGSAHKVILHRAHVWWLCWGKALMWLLPCELTQPLFFPHRTIFIGNNDWELRLFRLKCLVTFSLKKINEVSLSLHRKQLTVFIASDKIQPFKWKFDYGKLFSANVSLMTSWYLKSRLMRWLVTLININILILYNDICQHLEVLDNSVELPNAQSIMLQNYTWLKNPF